MTSVVEHRSCEGEPKLLERMQASTAVFRAGPVEKGGFARAKSESCSDKERTKPGRP